MSRYCFDEFVINAKDVANKKDIKDRKGNALKEWIAYGIIGFDEIPNAFFIQLDMGGEEPEVWLSGIKSIDTLIDVINNLFSVKKSFFKKALFKYNKILFK